MLNSIKKLNGLRILATDGEVGAVAQAAYFDDEQWVVRYLVVDTKAWLRGRSVLISPYAVTFIDWEARTIAVNLTRAQVEHSPDIDTQQPVSRQQEAEYHRYYGYPQYWPYAAYAAYWAWGAIPIAVPPDPLIREDAVKHRRAAADSRSADTHLRSSEAVLGYHVRSSDGLIGHVSDFLFEEETWAIRHLVVDTRNWLPGKHVLVAPQWIRAVSWAERTLSVALTRRQIEQSSEYDPKYLLSQDYEHALRQRDSRPHHRE
jgi:hypothetical protein